MASNKQQPETSTKPPPSFKQQLDHAAVQSASNGNGAVQNTLDTVIDKGTRKEISTFWSNQANASL